MNLSRPGRTTVFQWMMAAPLVLFLTSSAKAHPYASGITNSAGTIRYILNEGADNVKVAFDNGSVTNDLGAQSRGLQSFSLGAHTNYSIIVFKAGSNSVSQISVDATNNSFYGPRGVAVNRNPKTRCFGRVYVCNANAGILSNGPTNQSTYRGIYILNADTSDALGRGTNVSMPAASWGSSTTYAPYKCFVGPDDKLYVGDSSGLNSGSTTAGEPVWMIDPDVTVSNRLFVSGSSATNNNAGPCNSTPFVTGSLATGDLVLYSMLWNYASPPGTFNNVFKYSIGGGPVPWSNAPIVLGNAGSSSLNGQDEDLYLAPDGKLFVSQNKTSATGGNVSLRVFAADGVTQLWDSSSAGGGVDPFVDILGVAVSPDDAFVAASVRAGNFLLARLTNGVPDVSTLTTNIAGLGSITRGLAFDAADNVYVVSGGADRLRVFSPGLTTIAITANDNTGTNGTFQFSSSLNSPAILSQPQSQTVLPGALVTMAVTAAGTPPLSYQWTFNGANMSDTAQISGSHSNKLSITGVTLSSAGNYQVVVSHSNEAITSIVALLTVVTSQPPVWTQMANSPGPNSTRHDDIYFTDPLNGWASQNNYIYRTTNGGGTWATSLNLSGTHFRSVAFATPLVGFAGNLGPGSYDGGVSNTNVLYRTYDGGVTWSNVPGFAEAGMKGLCVVNVLDSQHIYGGGRVRGPAFFIKSTDGGTNWSMVNLTAMGVMNAIMDVYFKDPMNGWVVGMDTNTFVSSCGGLYYGRIARTTNGGTTWTPVVTTPVSCSYFWKMSWPSTNVGYASLQQNGSYSAVVFYKTTDGGNNWVSNGIPLSSIGSPASFYLQGLGFVSETEGWLGGASGIAYANSFIHTTDGGASWTPVGYDDTYFINRIRFLSPTLGFASGGNLHIYSPTLAITAQPQSQVVLGGANVNLFVAAVGVPPLGYQWQKNGANQSGATQTSLNLANVTRLDAGLYSVVVTNPVAGLVSTTATVRVLVPERLTAPARLPGGKLQLIFSDADGGALLTTNDLATFTVLASPDLTNWTVLTNTLSVTNGMMLFQDSTTSYPARFYRVVEH